MNKPEFKLGDTVTWESQARGKSKVKTGTVVHVLERDKTPFNIAGNKFPNYNIQFDGWRIPGKGPYGYFVEVQTGPKKQPKLYMPYPGKLRKVEE